MFIVGLCYFCIGESSGDINTAEFQPKNSISGVCNTWIAGIICDYIYRFKNEIKS